MASCTDQLVERGARHVPVVEGVHGPCDLLSGLVSLADDRDDAAGSRLVRRAHGTADRLGPSLDVVQPGPGAGRLRAVAEFAKLSEAAADALRRFNALANKSTGASHPYDRQRWFDFVIQTHTDRSELDPDLLHRWLIESEDWPEDQASDLAIEYERSRALLARFEETA